MDNRKRLFLLDSYALIFRAYYALVRNPRITSTGINTSAIFGFVNTLQDILKREQPTHIAACFDPGGKTFRHDTYQEYKANRQATPEDIKQAVPYIKRILEAYRIPIFQVEGYEADDVIGSIARQASGRGYDTFMVTGDKDLGQLVTDNVKIYHPGTCAIEGIDEIEAKYGGLKSPVQLIDILGLMGDSADNIPGCPGIGPKRAEALVAEFGSVENLLEHTDMLKGAVKRNIEAYAEQIRLSKRLAAIKTDVPVNFTDDEMKRVPVDYVALRKVFTELEFRSLISRIIDHGEANVGLEGVAPAAVTGTQGSLFPLGDDENNATAAGNGQTLATLKTLEHDYRLIADLDEAAQWVSQLAQEPQVGLHIVGTGDEAMTAQMLGIAVAGSGHKAAYMPLDDFGWMLDAVKPLFTGKTCLVSNDVKRDMVMLKMRGVDFNAPYYDTAIAHYLLQPEQSHSTAALAANLLHYEVTDPESYLGPKKRSHKTLGQVRPSTLAEAACELADVQICLPAVLDGQLSDIGLTRLFTDVELPLTQVLASMELAGTRVDVKALQDYSVTLSSHVATLEQECCKLAGEEFNTASPAQVGSILFDKLKLDEKAKKTKSGQYSTTEEILERLRDRHPLVGKILELRGLRKLLSTYVNALPALIDRRDGRIHTTYNQTVTATGRLSSANPNLQNIPVRTDEGKEIRRAFIPAEGNVFFSADYSQIELRLVADLSRDETMLSAFNDGLDIHTLTASKIYHEPIESVTPEQRRKAKTANFGILYGISAFGLSQRLQIPRNEAKMLIEGYFNTFPQVRDYIDQTVAQAKEKGYVTTIFGRRRMLPDINSRNAVVRSFSERNAVNAPIQGSAADIIKIAMVRIYRRFTELGLKSRMILQVHDELNFDVVPSELPQVREIVLHEMEDAYHGHVKLTASHGVAANWLDAH